MTEQEKCSNCGEATFTGYRGTLHASHDPTRGGYRTPANDRCDGPRLVEVRRCDSCPCGTEDGEGTEESTWYCIADPFGIKLTEADTPPDWCPLRKRSLTLTLVE